MPPRRIPGLLVFAGFAFFTAVLYFAKPVLMPVALAVLLAFLLSPIVRLAERVLPRAVAVVLVVLLAFGVLGAGSYMLYTQVSGLAAELPKYRDNIRHRIADLRGVSRGGAIENIQETARDVMTELGKTAPGQPKPPATERIVTREAPGARSLLALPITAAPLIEAVVQASLVVALVGFMLLRRQELRNRVIRLLGESRLTLATKAVDEVADRMGRYLITLSVVNAVFGLAVVGGLVLIGLPYALLWGVLAAVLRFIPYVGVWTAALLPITLSLAVFPGWLAPLLVVGLFAVLEPLIFLVVEPLVYRQRVGVSDVALLIAVAFWTWLWGAIGLVLAVPLTVCLIVLGKHVPDLRVLSILLGDDSDVDPALAVYQRLLVGDGDEAADLAEAQLDPQEPHAVYDNVLIPTLAYARRERASERISDEDRARLAVGFREMLDGLAPPAGSPRADAPHVIACPLRDDLDELGFVMLHHLLDHAAWRIEVASPEMLSSEVVARAVEGAPRAVCLGSVGIGALAQTRYLTKRLRAALPDTRILVARWGVGPLRPDEVSALTNAGADEVSTTLVETREQLSRAMTTRPDESRAAA